MKVPDNFILEINIHTKVTESGSNTPSLTLFPGQMPKTLEKVKA